MHESLDEFEIWPDSVGFDPDRIGSELWFPWQQIAPIEL